MRHLASLSLLLFALRPALFLAPAPRLARCELSLLRIAASPRATVDDEDILPPTLAADADDGMGRLMRPKDPTFMLTESERLRRQPVHGLKRKRRSRKIRTAEPNADKLLPIVPGARQTVEESIISAYVGDTLGKQQEAGEDYWVDPLLLKEEQEAKRMMEARRKNYKRNTQASGSVEHARICNQPWLCAHGVGRDRNNLPQMPHDVPETSQMFVQEQFMG